MSASDSRLQVLQRLSIQTGADKKSPKMPTVPFTSTLRPGAVFTPRSHSVASPTAESHSVESPTAEMPTAEMSSPSRFNYSKSGELIYGMISVLRPLPARPQTAQAQPQPARPQLAQPQPAQAQPAQAQFMPAQPAQAQCMPAQPTQAQAQFIPAQAQCMPAQFMQAQPVQAQPVQAQPAQPVQPVQAQPVQAQPVQYMPVQAPIPPQQRHLQELLQQMEPVNNSTIVNYKDIVRRYRSETDHDLQIAWIDWLDQLLDLEVSKNQTRVDLYALIQDLDRRMIDIEFFEHRESIFPHPYVMQFVLTLRTNRMLKHHYRGVSDTRLGAIVDALRQSQRDPQLLASRAVGSPTVTGASQTWAQKASMCL